MKRYLLLYSLIFAFSVHCTSLNSYNHIKNRITVARDSIGVKYKAASDEKKNEIMKHARGFVLNAIVNEIFPHWYNTEWDFNGTTCMPGEGKIACGYFVTHVISDAGFDIPRKWGKEISELIIMKLSSEIKKLSNHQPIEKIKDYIDKKEDGLYIVGLDFHVGFIYKIGDSVKFVHSNYLKPEIGVMSENIEPDNPVGTSNYVVIGRILEDEMMIKWLKKEKYMDKDVNIPSSQRSKEAIARVKPILEKELQSKGLTYGSDIYVRIFKEEKELDIWVKKGSEFVLFKTYPVYSYGSQGLGPKVRKGDGMAPEGFYYVMPINLNPLSAYHLAFNIGYPNAYDRHLGRTGSAIMVHGDQVSIGCFAMTDPLIEEIYALADSSLGNGQNYFRVHVFPFRMTDENLDRHKDNEWYDFWVNLKEGYDKFEEYDNNPPNVEVIRGRYVFNRE